MRRQRIGASESWRWRCWHTHSSIELAGNGFISAFVAGLAFGTVVHGPTQQEATLEFDSQSGKLLSLIVWFLFGAVLVTALDAVTWQTAVFAILALTVVRMVPVAIALIGEGFTRTTVAFIGWFGPRGLASVVFAVIAFDSLKGSEARRGARSGRLDRALERGRARAHRGATGTPVRRTCRRPRREHTGARGGPGLATRPLTTHRHAAGAVVPELEE